MMGQLCGDVLVQRRYGSVKSFQHRDQAGGAGCACSQKSGVVDGGKRLADRFHALLNARLGARGSDPQGASRRPEKALDGLALSALQLLQSGPTLQKIAAQRRIDIVDPVQRLGEVQLQPGREAITITRALIYQPTS